MERLLRNLTVDNAATKIAFSEKCQSEWVIISAGDAQDISGRVVAFMPDRRLQVMDDYGVIHHTTVGSVVEDVGRRIYEQSRPDKRVEPEFHAEIIARIKGAVAV